MKVSVLWSWHPSIVRDLKGQAGKVAQLVEFFPYKPEDPSALIGTHIKKARWWVFGVSMLLVWRQRIPGAHWVSQPSLTRVLAPEEQDLRLTFGAFSLFLIILLSHLYIADFGLCLLGFFYPVEFLFLMDCSCDLSPSSVYLESLSHNFLCKEDQLMVLMSTLFVQQFFWCVFCDQDKVKEILTFKSQNQTIIPFWPFSSIFGIQGSQSLPLFPDLLPLSPSPFLL